MPLDKKRFKELLDAKRAGIAPPPPPTQEERQQRVIVSHQDALHKWGVDHGYYPTPIKQAPPHNPLAPRDGNLLASKSTHTALGYAKYKGRALVEVHQSPAFEFVLDVNLISSVGFPKGFRVAYKHEEFWYVVEKHFETLASAMPYLQSGIRVLIEFI